MAGFPMKVLLMVALAHAIVCPFTKVEESFNTQAMHDVYYIMLENPKNISLKNLERFDHFEFPGVVPRTFTGAWVVALASIPLKHLSDFALSNLADIESLDPRLENEGFLMLLCVRTTLAYLVWMSLNNLSESLGRKLGKDVEKWFGWVCCSQFHLVFYMGRPLPNTFAMALCSLALSKWLDGVWEKCIAYLVFCTVVFRCDTLILTGIVALTMLLRQEVGLTALIIEGFAFGIASLVFTAGLDSVMWDRPLWPEGVVLFFNTVLNKSKEWGVMPPLWYFVSALPRALLASYPLAVLGVFQSLDKIGKPVPAPAARQGVIAQTKAQLEPFVDLDALMYFSIPAFGYVSLYSLLPHKEVRFLFQVFPFLSCLAAFAVAKLSRSSSKAKAVKGKKVDDSAGTKIRRFFAWIGFLGSCVGLMCSFAVASVHLSVSYRNYPGADALLYLQRYHEQYRAKGGEKMNVHYCTFAAMSGITRFLEHGSPHLLYSKREDEAFLGTLCEKSAGFEYLIMEVDRFKGDAVCEQNFRVLKTVEGKPVLDWRNQQISTQPVLYVLQRK